MQQFGIKGGALAIAKDGRIVYSRGYTLAEKNYPVIQPTSLFRIASVSKPVTSLAIHKLIENDSLTLDTLIQDILKINLPKQDPKPKKLKTFGYYFDKITVKHLLLHQGGWNREDSVIYDPTYQHDKEVAKAVNNGVLPISKKHLMEWGVKQQQQMYPGTESHYSNYGYLLLGMIIEKLTGISYSAMVRNRLLLPLGIIRPLTALTTESQRRKGEVQYHVIPAWETDCTMGPGKCPIQYGGENMSNFDSFGGWLFSPVDYVKLFGSFRNKVSPLPKLPVADLLTIRPKPGLSKTAVYDHGGDLPGSWAYMAYRGDGVDFMVVWNTSNAKDSFSYSNKTFHKGTHTRIWHQLLDSVKTWPAYDLSPAYFGNETANSLTENTLYDGIWNWSDKETILERGKLPRDFQALYSSYYKKNYRLSHQQSYYANGVLMRDGIWTSSAEGQFVCWDKSLGELEALYSEWRKKNYRLTQLQAYVRNGKVYYNGIWDPGQNSQFVTWEKPFTEFSKLNDEMTKKGLHLVYQNVIFLNGKKLYSGIWDPAPGFHLQAYAKKREDFIKLSNEYYNQNFRLIQFQAYYENNQLVYDGIWAPGKSSLSASWGKNNEWIDAENIIQKNGKFQPYLLAAY